MNCKMSKQGTATIVVGFEISGINELKEIVEKIRNVEGVLDIERTTG